MAGLFGFTLEGREAGGGADTLAYASMGESLRHAGAPGFSPAFADCAIMAGQVEPQVKSGLNPPAHKDGLHVWVDGELFDPITPDVASFFLACYAKDRSFDFLRTLNGVFSAVIYDSQEQKLFCLTDRFGLQYLYWSWENGRFSWGSELKVFLPLPWFTPEIPAESVSCFLEKGYFAGNKTWFNQVSLVPCSSVVSFSFKSKKINTLRYWDIPAYDSLDQASNEKNYPDLLADCFERAVAIRCRAGERITVGLSGGLDSRAILAAIPKNVTDLGAYSFGRANSPDLRIASQAAGVRGVPHRIELIHAGNWLEQRIAALWTSDGMLDVMHMHGVEALPAIGRAYDVELNGFLGDALLGGSYGTDTAGMFTKFFERGRRMIRAALLLCAPYVQVRMPFADKDLLDCIVRMPQSLRKNSRLYNAMLVKRYPEYFKTIPWQKAGMPVSFPHSMVWSGVVCNKILHRAGTVIPFFRNTGLFTDYAGWIRSSPAQDVFKRVLTNPDCLYKKYLDANVVSALVREHNRGNNRSGMLCRYLTLEIWLQQAFNRRWYSYREIAGK